jgi:glycosyltransferase involved in cell wall biosynthesis
MSKKKNKIVWFCGLPEKVRQEAFADLGLPESAAWSWIVGHLPPPEDIDLHIVCGDRRLGGDVTREWKGATFHLVKVLRGGPFFMYEGWAPAFVRKARELHPDIIHGWGTEGAFGLATIRAAPKKHLVGIQGILAVTWPVMHKNLQNLLCVLNERRVLRRARHCVAESNYSKRTVARLTSASVDVVPQPLREEFLRAKLGDRSEKIIVYLGVLAHRKGVYDAISAFLAVESDWKLVLPSTRKRAPSPSRITVSALAVTRRLSIWAPLPNPAPASFSRH